MHSGGLSIMSLRELRLNQDTTNYNQQTPSAGEAEGVQPVEVAGTERGSSSELQLEPCSSPLLASLSSRTEAIKIGPGQ